MVDDDTGRLHPLPEKVLGSALGGAFLLELASAGCLDNDTETVFLPDTTTAGNVLLDGVLEAFAAEGTPLPCGCSAAFFPEADLIAPIGHTDPESCTTTSRGVPVIIRPAGAAG